MKIRLYQITGSFSNTLDFIGFNALEKHMKTSVHSYIRAHVCTSPEILHNISQHLFWRCDCLSAVRAIGFLENNVVRPDIVVADVGCSVLFWWKYYKHCAGNTLLQRFSEPHLHSELCCATEHDFQTLQTYPGL